MHLPSAEKEWQTPAASQLPSIPFFPFRETPLDVHATSYFAASAKIASRETVIPAVAKNKMDAVVMAKVADLFPVDVDKYIFTYKVQGSDYQDKDQGKVRNVRIFAAPSDLIESFFWMWLKSF